MNEIFGENCVFQFDKSFIIYFFLKLFEVVVIKLFCCLIFDGSGTNSFKVFKYSFNDPNLAEFFNKKNLKLFYEDFRLTAYF